MAKQTKKDITETTSDRVERIKAALAADKTVSTEDQQWIEDFDAKQDVINTALLEGRHIEKMREVVDGKTHVTWVEYIPVPGGEMNVSIRQGYDVITPGPTSDVVTRIVNYFEPGNIFPKGTLTSFISNGQERITGITGFGPGGEYAGLQIGDMRPSPVPTNGPAGIKPSSWDPGDAILGKASGGTSADPNLVDPLQNDIDAFVNSSLSAPLPGDTSAGSSQSGSGNAAGLGSPGARGAGSDPAGVGPGIAAGAGDNGGSDGGDAMDDSVDADPGTTDEGGGDEQGDPSSAQEGSDPDAGASGDLAGGGDESAAPQGQVTAGEGQIEVGTFYTKGESSDTYEYPSGDTVEIPHDSGGGGGGDTDASGDEERHAADDYYSAGSAPTPQPGSGQDATIEKSGGGGGGGSASEMSWEQWQAHMAATWTDPNWNPEGAPIDYGDEADPNHDPVIPKSDEMVKEDEVTPRILVDPSFYEESTTGPTTKLEMANTLENTGNPLDENQVLAPGGGMPSTSEQENVGGDAMAATSPDLVGSVEQDDPDDDGPGAIGSGPGGDDLP